MPTAPQHRSGRYAELDAGQLAGMPTAPQHRSGRYAELDAGQLADVVEHAYERDELPDWELVFELSRRATSTEASDAASSAVGASRQA